jgi:hypothetical protein
MGNWPQFSYPFRGIQTKLDTWGGNNSPMPYASGKGGVSGLMPWIRVISSYGATTPESSKNGLILQSNYPEDGFNIRYGNGSTGQSAESGICGFELDYKTPVRVKGRPTRPGPIISGLSVSEVDVGRKTTNFSITCYTLEHMEKLAKYFLEPGFYVLVEWGWNTRDARKNWCGNSETGAITPCMMSKYMNQKYILQKRISSNFEYDATLGLTTNGGVKFGDNETFILDIQLTSQGEVAEYMQGHKGGSSNSTKNISSERYDPAEIDDSASKDGVAKALFRQMFNDLNSEKQTTEIKAWESQNISDKKKDYAFIEYNKPNADNLWADESNYINIDKVMQTSILKALKDTKSVKATKDDTGSDFEMPEDKPLLSPERFIRFELACAIMNEDFTEKSSKAEGSLNSSCSGEKVSHIINIDTSICGAFPHMYSLDKNILYLPNPTAPSFNIDNAFNGETTEVKFVDLENLNSNLQNLHPKPTDGINWTGTRKKNNDGFGGAPHAFPCQYDLTTEDNKWEYDPENSVKSYEMKKGYWGWLKNMYINFDYFNKVMKTPNYTIRDVLYDLLNGMSSAVNSHWKFQIIERAHPNTGKTELQVVDMNFSGIINHVEDKIPTYQLRGTTSPFIEVDFDVTTPAAMQNSILQKRASNDKNAETIQEFGGLIPVVGSVWSNPDAADNDGITPVDMVGTILSGIKFKEPAIPNEKANTSETQEKDADAIRSANYQFFTGKAGVYPKVQNRNDMAGIVEQLNEGNVKEVFMVGTFNDPLLLRQIYLKDIDAEGWRDISSTNGGKVNTPFGMAKVNFKVHGISGFKRGDTLRFSGLPKNFSNPHVYEVTGLEHEVTTTGWYTTVQTGMRAYGSNTAAK